MCSSSTSSAITYFLPDAMIVLGSLHTVKRHFYARVLFMRIMRGDIWSDKFVSHYIILA